MGEIRASRFLFFFLALIALFSFVYGLSFSVTPEQSSANSSVTNWQFNFTIINSNTTANITQFNITLPLGFVFVENSNSTNVASVFNYDENAGNLSWTNDTSLINADSSAWFSFNLSIPLIFRRVNFTFTILDSSGILNTTNVSIDVLPEAISGSREFGLLPAILRLNQTNSYQASLFLLSNSSADIQVELDNSSALTPGYSQGSSIYLKIKNNTEEFSRVNSLPSSSNTNYTVLAYCWYGEFMSCNPGKYFGYYKIKNKTNDAENITITIFLDNPLYISPTNGTGFFSGNLPQFADEYHSFYFDKSSIPNATSITVNLTFNKGDVDMFLLTNDTVPRLLAKSISKNNLSEVLSYNFIKEDNITYELRIYGNTSEASGISYNGIVIFTSLNSTPEEVDFGVQNITNSSITKFLNLRNEGDIPLNDVKEEVQTYKVERFDGNTPNNFSIFVLDSSLIYKIIVRLNWTGEAYYSLTLFNNSGVLIANSSNKFLNAKICNVEKEEFLETDKINTNAGIWRIEVKNMTTNISNYTLIFQSFLKNPLIQTNFSNYTNKTFDILGSENSTKYLSVKFLNETKLMSGLYEGFLIYKVRNGGQIKIPFRINITTPTLVVNDTMQIKELIIQENYNSTLTRTIYLNLSNYGDYNLTTSFFSSGNLGCSGSTSSCSGYSAVLAYNSTSEIPSKSSSVIEVNVSFNSSMPKNSLYEGWIYINSTHPTDSNLTSHPYPGFNISIKLNLTDLWKVFITSIKSADWGNESINVSSKPSWVNVTFNIKYINSTNVTRNTLFNYKNIKNVWLFEPNASFYVNSTRNLNFTRLGSNDTETIPPSDWEWGINISVPANVPGGKYYIHINLTSINFTSNPSDVYHGESLDDPVNKLLIVDDMGLLMGHVDYPSSLQNGTSGTVNVTIKNLGPRSATNVQILLEKCELVSSITFLNSSCSLLGTPSDRVNFTLSSFNYTGCYVAWRITAGNSAGSCTSWIKGTSGSWFYNRSFSTEVYIPETATTTTLLPNITIPTTTTTTTTTIPPNITTTTTTIPLTVQSTNETLKISLITPEAPAIFNISRIDSLKILKITVAVKTNVSNVVLNLREASKPEEVAPPIPEKEGLVLKYLEISVVNLTEANIANVKIDFQVEKTWLGQNDVDASTVSLYRYFNNSWQKLSTKRTNVTANYYLYQATSPGFSLFAIAGKKIKAFPIWAFFTVLGIIVAAILAFLFWPVEEKKPAIKAEEKEKIGKIGGGKQVQKTEEKEEISKPWEELKKKWEELTKRKKS